MKSKTLIIIGCILIAVGFPIGFISFFALLVDPGEDALYAITPPDTVSLEKGEYDIWFEGSEYDMPDSVRVTDSDGTNLFRMSSSSESVTSNGREYHKVGEFELKSDDQVYITASTNYGLAEFSGDLYITEPISIGTSFLICGSFVAIGCIGGLILMVGIIFMFMGKDKKVEYIQDSSALPPYQYGHPAQYPSQYPAQYPQQPPPQYPQQPPPRYPPY
ncbi:MAG: hypothetical protein JSV49_08085 [Thermoplasmata archaeon]|nr:MAG: hypothetical protein JSV49_08085 [Thermoplasmata archaeon]